MSISKCCRLFGVSRQSYYQMVQRQKLRAEQLALIRPKVDRIRRKMPRIGTRKLHYLLAEELQEAGIKIGRDGLFDYLRSKRLLVKRLKNYTKTTNSKHWLTKHPNLLEGLEVTRAEEVFVSDITYVKSRERTHYLSLVTDAYTRKIMGYKLSNDMSAENVVKALKMAVKLRVTDKPLIHHSDRGLQYCSKLYQKNLAKHNITPSMTDGYDCYQNALAERINGILKQEFLLYRCKNRQELDILVKESINTYNNERPHLSLNYKTPNYIHQKTTLGTQSGFN